MSKNQNQSSNHHPIDYAYTHSPPSTAIDLEPPSKRLKTSASLPPPFLTTDPQPVAAIAIPHKPARLPPSSSRSCPPWISHAFSSTCPTILAPLYSLPDFKVGSLPHQLPSAWPTSMINEFLTPPSTRSLSFSDPSSASSLAGDHPFVFDMDD